MSSSLSLLVLAARTIEAMALVTTARILIKINMGNGWMMDKETITMIMAIQTKMITGMIMINILATCHVKVPVTIRSLASLSTFRSPRHRKIANRNASRKSNRRSSRSVSRRNSKRNYRSAKRTKAHNARSFPIRIKAKNKAARWIDSR